MQAVVTGMHREVLFLYSWLQRFVRRWIVPVARPNAYFPVMLGLLIAASVSASSVTYTYDEGGRLKLVIYDNGSQITYALDAAGNRKSVVQSLDTTAPAAPTGLAGAPTTATNINLTWTACADTSGSLIAGYKIYRGGTQIGTSTTANYSDGTVVGSTTYTYTVACYDNAGNNSAQSAPVNVASLDTTPPSVPTGLAASAPASGTVNLTWTTSTDTGGSGLAGYKIYRTGVQIGTSTTASYSDTTTTGTTTYSYTVAAYDNAGNVSAQSSAVNVTTPDTIPPSAPTGLAVVAPASGTVNLNWSAPTDTGGSGLAGYKIYRGGVQIGISASTSYSDTTTLGTTSYTYAVAAYDNAGNTSAQSTSASVTTPDTIPPSVPSGLVAAAPASGTVNLSWSAATDTGGSGLAGYKIYRAGAQIGTSASASYSDTTTTGTTTYNYTVAAYDNAGNTSAQSTAAGVTTPDTIPPSVPTGLAATAPASGTVNLTWTASTDTGGSGLAGYKIYRAGTQIGVSASASYSDTTTSGTTAYSYTVAAYDNAGNTSAQSSTVNVTTPDTIPPSVPTGLTATVISASQVNLSWTASTDTGGSGIYSYQIYRNGARLVGTLTTSYSDTGVGGSTTYTYTVAAVDHALNYSAQSAPATVTTPSNIPSTPGTPAPSGIVTTTTWTEGWAASTGPVAYYILSQNAAGVVTTFSVTAPSTSSVQSEADGSRFRYSVQACNSSNQCSGSSPSSAVQVCEGGVCP
jgi:chitodextrinase